MSVVWVTTHETEVSHAHLDWYWNSSSWFGPPTSRFQWNRVWGTRSKSIGIVRPISLGSCLKKSFARNARDQMSIWDSYGELQYFYWKPWMTSDKLAKVRFLPNTWLIFERDTRKFKPLANNISESTAYFPGIPFWKLRTYDFSPKSSSEDDPL